MVTQQPPQTQSHERPQVPPPPKNGMVRDVANRALAAGLSVVPPLEDGSKAPLTQWKSFQKQRPTEAQLRRWYERKRSTGVGFVCGAISGGLTALETDEAGVAEAYVELAHAVGLGELIDRIRDGYEDASPGGGIHWLYRCVEALGNTELAQRPKTPEEMRHKDDKTKVLIETRGEGGYIVAAPSNGTVHPSGGAYVQIKGGVEDLATITPQEQRDLWALARTFDEMPRTEVREPAPNGDAAGDRPGDHYNARGDVPALLEKHGWVHVYDRGAESSWRRPGKDKGISATYNYRDSRLFHVFTTSTAFAGNKSVQPFTVYATLGHGGDFAAAAKSLRAEGFGAERAASGTFTHNGTGTPADDPAGHDKPTVRFRATDTGNAERLVARHGTDIRFNYSREVWHIWTGTHWGEDDAGQMEQKAKETARSIPAEADGLSSEAYVKRLKWAADSESAGKRTAMVRLAQSEPGIPVLAEHLDFDPWLLNVANGTLDLRTGELRPHDRADLITRCLKTPYDPAATCPIFDGFLHRIFAGDANLITYVQRMIGYSLTGSIREQAIFIAFGGGANGKTTLVSTIATLLENYATEADTDTFLQQQGDKIREDIAALEGARFVAASETADGKRLSEAFVKKATGGEKLRARRLYENGYTFIPQCKVWLSTNHRPLISGTDHAIWRRIRLLPFAVTIPPHERDLDLPAKLEAELPGVLAWAVAGCRDWLNHGEQPPKVVLQATEQYRRDMDALANWIEDRCELRPGVRTAFKVLHEDYIHYCVQSGEEPLTSKTMGGRLTERGCTDTKSGSTRFRVGIRLKDPNTPHQTGLEETSSEDGTDGTGGTGESANYRRGSLVCGSGNNLSHLSHLSQEEYDISEWDKSVPWDMKPGEEGEAGNDKHTR